MKEVLVNELFSGIGTQSLAFEYLNIPHRVVGMCEISEPAIKVYNVLHGETRNYGDISAVDTLDYADFWTYSFPCFTGNMLVMTELGEKKIKEVQVGDKVYTHMGRLREVKASGKTGEREISIVSTKDAKIETTKNHRFYAKMQMRYGVSGKAVWVACDELRVGDLLGVRKGEYNDTNKPTDFAIEDEDFYWVEILEIDHTTRVEDVYDITVEEDHSFLVLGVAVHNCQDLSAGGKRKGMVEGTRSGLLWEVERLLRKSVEDKTQPKYLLLENVPEISNTKNINYFNKWLAALDELGYNSFWRVCESQYYGVPQMRKRMFVVSVRKDINKQIVFNDELGVDKSLYGFENPRYVRLLEKPSFEEFVDKDVLDYNGPLMIDPTISPSIRETYERDLYKIASASPLNTNIFACECKSGFQDKQVGINVCPTLRHQNSHTAIFVNNQIHKLTGREAWKFMGIKGEDYDRAVESTGYGSNMMFGLAGNAIVVTVLMQIYKALFEEGVDYER